MLTCLQRFSERHSLRKRDQDLLVDLRHSPVTSDACSDLQTNLQTTLGENATVCTLKSKALFEVRSLDKLTTEEEVTFAIRSVLGTSAEITIFVSKANS